MLQLNSLINTTSSTAPVVRIVKFEVITISPNLIIINCFSGLGCGDENDKDNSAPRIASEKETATRQFAVVTGPSA